MAHPGHPALSTSGTLSADRDKINEAVRKVSTTTQSSDIAEVDATTHGTHILADATAAPLTFTLAEPGDDEDARYVVKKVDASGNSVTIDTPGVSTIDGAASVALAAQYDSVTVWNDGSEWYVE